MPKHAITAIVKNLPTQAVSRKILYLSSQAKCRVCRYHDLRRMHLVHCRGAQNPFALKRSIAELKDHPCRKVGRTGLDCSCRRRHVALRPFSWGHALNAVNKSMAGSDVPHCRRQGEDRRCSLHAEWNNDSPCDEVLPGCAGRSGGSFTSNRKADVRINPLGAKGSRNFHVLNQTKELGTTHTCEGPGAVRRPEPGAMAQQITHRNIGGEVGIGKLYCRYVSSYRGVPRHFLFVHQ